MPTRAVLQRLERCGNGPQPHPDLAV